MKNMILAFATDDGVNFTEKHFGDADYYVLYEFTNNSANSLSKIANITKQQIEEIHADPKKAGRVVNMLQKENVKVVISPIFGPNIKRIKHQFVCILESKGQISDCIPRLINNFTKIQKMWDAGEERDYLNLKIADK